jgi:hypothetical protein
MLVALLALGATPAGGDGRGGERGGGETNLEVLQSLLARMSDEIAAQSRFTPGDTVRLRVAQGEEHWIARNAIAARLKTLGCVLFLVPDSAAPSPAGGGYVMEVHSAPLRVRYDDMFRDGLLGTRKVRRTVSAAVTCDVFRPGSREAAYSGSPSLSAADTVAADDVSSLELASAKETRSELPSEGFLDRVLAPAVIIGATGVSIYLFFHVRS